MAISAMLAVISSVAAATVLTLVVICSVAAAMLFMLVAISSAAEATVADWLVVSSAPLANCVAVAESSVDEPAKVFALPAICLIMPCNFSTKVLNQWANSPISSLAEASSRAVRSPSPWAMSLIMSTVCLIGLTIMRVMI